ncbi:acetyl-CoA carboxyl transferase [Micromonospora rosaria]|uniref:Multifunctional fusion protein n=1 Tax=Micromonospora rosaria TaxID=47874 RepID=A0A136PZJ4_9ACTN|nr:acetyl-CoA carboxyl transferase [Micromonospora rosaria]
MLTDAASWRRCGSCAELIYQRRFLRNLRVCPHCAHHERLDAPARLAQLLDPGSAEPLPAGAATVVDPLDFVDDQPYPHRLKASADRTGLDEAVVCVRGRIEDQPVVVAAMDFRFMGGSLGVAVGERITAAAGVALRERVPLLVVTASGGARMQEGALSLMQMAKTSQAMAALDEAGILTLSVATDPTYGGVAASFASLADVIIAEPGVRMGFAGRRVIAQTIRQELPADFQSAEFLLEHGLIDLVTPRAALRGVLGQLLRAGRRWPGPPPVAPADRVLVTDAAALPERRAWDSVQLARHVDRPTTLDYAAHLLDWFVELRGDRMGRDCRAIVGGIGLLDGRPVLLIGQQKGHTTRELVDRNFGMPSPEGYRKAARLMRLAAKVGMPVVTFVDTPGAYPGMAAEQHGQAAAIAENLRLMSGLPVPVVSVVTGEGGSGGALAIGVADRVLACENAVYSVISPEGCAAILWRDPAAAPTAAEALRLTARELLRLGIVDGVVPEPAGGSQRDHVAAGESVRAALAEVLADLAPLAGQELIRSRRQRYLAFGREDVGDSAA